MASTWTHPHPKQVPVQSSNGNRQGRNPTHYFEVEGGLDRPYDGRRLGIDRRRLETIIEAGGIENVAGDEKAHGAQVRYAQP